MVVGFHHKKGCQLEFVYPIDNRIQKTTTTTVTTSAAADHGIVVVGNDTNDLYKLPKRWKHLPSMALPDGSHNYTSDYVYFHLENDENEDTTEAETPTPATKPSESLDLTTTTTTTRDLKPKSTVFGVSCYRQINASEMLIKDVDVTRNTLQKSVCILARQPVYSSLRLKLHSITSAFFEQKDFRKTQLLVSAFENLRKSYQPQNLLSQNRLLASAGGGSPSPSHSVTSNANKHMDERSKYLMGLTLADLVLRYQHKILVLFKLLLLQKKCLFQLKPVSNLSNTIMALVSLVPDVFMPSNEENGRSGLDVAGGFFDSIELVNCELERKNSKKTLEIVLFRN